MTAFGDGLAEDADLVIAAERATAEALDALGGARPDLMVVFVCGGEADDVAAALQRTVGLAQPGAAIGCSAPGVIGRGRGIEGTAAVATWVAALPDVRVRSFALEVLPVPDGTAVVGMPERVVDDAVVVLLADPWSFPIDGFVEQANVAVPGLPIVGGLGAGSRGRGSTRLICDGRVVDRGAVGVMLGGPVAARALVSQGCRPVGPAMTVTGADGNVLLELAGVPALRKLQDIIAVLPIEEQAMVTSGLHLGIAWDEYVEEHGQGDFLIRGVVGVDDARSGLVVGDLVPVGRTVQFQVRDAVAADLDLRRSLEGFREQAPPGGVDGALMFSCNGRGANLFGTADHDPGLVSAGLASSGVAGCFAAGEIGPIAGRNYVHGFTASILAFGSAAEA